MFQFLMMRYFQEFQTDLFYVSSFKANVAIIEPHRMTSTANQLSGFCMKGAFIVNAVSAASLFFKSKREHLSN